jgi:hypothetical protein
MASLAVPAMDPILVRTFAISSAAQLAVFYGSLAKHQRMTEKQKSWIISTFTRSVSPWVITPSTIIDNVSQCRYDTGQPPVSVRMDNHA